MSILSKNIRTIRKELKCTQGAMAEILKVGFRTYVRYEAGERDASVGTLVKLSRLGNISLERLLTQEMTPYQLSPMLADRLDYPKPEIKSFDMKRGIVRFKNPATESIIAMDSEEMKLLALFRKLPEPQQEAFLNNIGKKYRVSGSGKRTGSWSTTTRDKKNMKEQAKVLEQAGAIKPDTKPSPGKPGRKKLNRKSLKEKISKLKSVTRSVRKTTVG
ncbi:MAG: helix-turn-helix domain-containing protein [Candidatus Nitronauta litoralis]|uniref:Helix-turn-helix domain-containing protein n=1 Tax=Candidatus Nitronauta litoralis TaxID=2705533 RepID=A0A7T0BY81_9BACT|nr:MAG: helix-turn-helix domain-containing protein [Candidatus Nitronauta litoralis]